nr:LPS export ABC transporter permease LptG [Desulfobacterales bacterium]
MIIITKYILKEFIKTFLVTLFAFIMIYILVEFFERIDNFIEAGATFRHAITYFLFKVPFVLTQMVPVAILLGTMITLGLLSRNNEIVALKASGISIFRIVTPLFSISLLISIFSFINNEIIVPYTSRTVNDVWNNYVEKRPRQHIYKHEMIWYRGKNVIYNIRTFNSLNRTMEGVVINQFDCNFRLVRRIKARKSIWKEGYWLLLDGTLKDLEPDGEYRITIFNKKEFKFSETPEDFEKVVKQSDEMSFWELREYARKIEAEGYDARRYIVDMHNKISFPFISLIMSLVGISFSLSTPGRGGIAMSISMGFVIIILYIITFKLSETLGYSGMLPPVVAAWTANILFVGVGTYLFLNIS